MIVINFKQYIEKHILRCEVSNRGGGIEISLEYLLTGLDDPKMTAYQNYLGGGMLGSIGNSYNFDRNKLNKEQSDLIEKLSDALNRYYYKLTASSGKYESESFEGLQARALSAY